MIQTFAQSYAYVPYNVGNMGVSPSASNLVGTAASQATAAIVWTYVVVNP